MIRRNWRSVLILMSIATDIAIIFLCCVLAYFILGFIPGLSIRPTYLYRLVGAACGIILLCSAMIIGVYRLTFNMNSNRQYYLATKAYLITMLLLFSSMYLFREYSTPRFLIFFFLFIPILFHISRLFLNKLFLFLKKCGYCRNNVLLAGYNDGGLSIANYLKKHPEFGYEIKGIIEKNTAGMHDQPESPGARIHRYALKNIENVIYEQKVTHIFIPSHHLITNGYSPVLPACKKNGVVLKVLFDNSNSLTKISRVYDIAGITIYSPKRKHIDNLKKILKRSFDIAVGSVLLLLSLPVLLIASLAIFVESGSPIIFKQKRTAAKGGKVFYFYKLRSMLKNADKMKETLHEWNESDGALFKIKDDPRLTKVGKIIRKFSIDELPQLFNVIKGDMSIVGPRPLPVADFEKIEFPDDLSDALKARERTKPGVTGLWQISGRSSLSFRDMIYLDLYYIENQSFLFDLEILFATVPVVVTSKGAY